VAVWLTFLRERLPLAVYVPLALGFTLSGVTLGGGLALQPALPGFIGLLAFFALLRLMDECKDLDKDRVAHPDRPLPRGLLTPAQVQRAIAIGAALMLAWALVTAWLASPAAGACYLLVTVYLWLMYREFYCGAWLEPRPLLYALSHQLILIPLAFYSILASTPAAQAAATALPFGLLLLGAFFAYEVCRKLDPEAHPVLRTYLRQYGRGRTALLVAATLLVAASGAAALDLGAFLWPIEAALLLSLALLWLRPDAFKIPEAIAGVSLLAHVWALPAQFLWSRL